MSFKQTSAIILFVHVDLSMFDRSGASSEWESASSTASHSHSQSQSHSREPTPAILKFGVEDPPGHAQPESDRVSVVTHQAVNDCTAIQLTPALSLKASSRVQKKRPFAQQGHRPIPQSLPVVSHPRDVSRPVFLLPIPTYIVASVRQPADFAGMETVDVPELVDRLGSGEDAVRKMAVFKLQSNIGDPSFAEMFIHEGGLPKLKSLAMNTTGNTLAYSLTSFSRLLEVDKGWEFVEQDLIKRARMSEAAY